MKTPKRIAAAIWVLLSSLAMMPAAEAKIAILGHPQITLLDVITPSGLPEPMAAARALSPGIIVGVYPEPDPHPAKHLNARGFSADNPVAGPATVRAPALPLTGSNSSVDLGGSNRTTSTRRG